MVKLTEQALRDGNQSLLASRMKTEDMLPIAGKIDEIGFFSVEVWSRYIFDCCLRNLNEDPWERLRKLKELMPHTMLKTLIRGQSIFGYQVFPDDIVRTFIKYAVKNGCGGFTIFDSLGDSRNMKVPIEAAREEGAYVEAVIDYVVSPFHTLETYIEKAKELERLGSNAIAIHDSSGIMLPSNAKRLVSSLKEELKIPITLHGHLNTGLATICYMEACEGGVDILDTAFSPMSGGVSIPPTEPVAAALKDSPYETGYDLKLLNDCRDYFSKLWDKYVSARSWKLQEIDMGAILHQLPGGMMSFLISYLKEQNASDRFNDVLEEVARIRKDFGYPPLVTPSSQIVASQAVLNVMSGERYKVIAKESKDYVKGMYGKPPGEISKDVKEKILGKNWKEQVVSCRPADLLPNRLNEVTKEAEALGIVSKPEDVVTYALYPDLVKKMANDRSKTNRRFKISFGNKTFVAEVEEQH